MTSSLATGTPRPVSVTEMLTVSSVKVALTDIVPPALVNLIAFERRLSRI